MLRNKNLIPLSHQHQRALALCVRIDRAQPIPDADLPAWQAEIGRLYDEEIMIHFEAEESLLFPAARRFSELIPLVEELVDDHGNLRELFSQAGTKQIEAKSLEVLAETLSAHIRKEERQLFEQMQKLMTMEELSDLGTQLQRALADAPQSCVLPNEVTKLRGAVTTGQSGKES